MSEQWITYELYHGKARQTRLATERVPPKHTGKRAATAEEIVAEIERRDQTDKALLKQRAYEADPRYRLANWIRSEVESWDRDRNGLDKLSLEEWEVLYNKLT